MGGLDPQVPKGLVESEVGVRRRPKVHLGSDSEDRSQHLETGGQF